MRIDENVIAQMRIGAADAVDFFELAGAEGFVLVEAPETFEQALTAEDFMQTGDAAAEDVRGVEEGRVAVGDLDAETQQLGCDVGIAAAFEQFDRPSDFYSTSAHEHTHWTGHADRLGRDLSGRFGDHTYGAEELIAELGAAFWCAQFELGQATREDHAAYLGDWLALLQSDSRALVAACGHAQRAVDHLNTLAGWSPPSGSADEPLEVAA